MNDMRHHGGTATDAQTGRDARPLQGDVKVVRSGYPLEHRTLFTEVTLMPGGHSFRVEATGRVELTRSWEPPTPQSATSPASDLSLQVEAFRQAVSRLRLSHSLLSLTGGLDTRTILAALSQAGVGLLACTLMRETLRATTGAEPSEHWLVRTLRRTMLAHRFVGQPRTRSFQRRLIEATGGAVAEFPINWGWRAKGGVSPQGLGWGLLAFADSVSSRTHLLSTFGRKSLHFVGADGVGETTQYRRWFDTVLRDFVNDTRRSRLVTQSELFDAGSVARLSDEHYRGARSHYDTLVATPDLALAQQFLGAPVPPSRDSGERRTAALSSVGVAEA